MTDGPLVALAGASCAGKTVAAEILADRFGWRLSAGAEHLEPETVSGAISPTNPSGDLETERWFCDVHRRRGLDLDERPTIADWSLLSDVAYARATLAPADLVRFTALHEDASVGIRPPDVWIVLALDPHALAVRKSSRSEGRRDDEVVSVEWLRRVQDAHLRIVRGLGIRGGALRIADSTPPERVADAVASIIHSRLSTDPLRGT